MSLTCPDGMVDTVARATEKHDGNDRVLQFVAAFY